MDPGKAHPKREAHRRKIRATPACLGPDKVGQDIGTLLLEAADVPEFFLHSHGCRPHRGCQTALTEIHNVWGGTKWFIEGDIKGCCENIDHTILMHILQENIHDNRFLRLIEGALKAGYCEEWTYHPALSGSPQGGIVSPILSHIYLDRLDKCVEDTLIPEYTRGENGKRIWHTNGKPTR